MSALRFLAGATAFNTLAEQGLKSEHFTQLLAASGGPKWLGIAGLDKYLFSEFFKNRQTPLYTLGASSGAWRLACLAQQDPLAAYGRLEDFYIGQRYDSMPTPQEVSAQVKGVVQGILGASGGSEIVNNAHIHSHLVVCRGKHLNRLTAKLPLAAGLAMTAATNLVSRRSLGWHFERVVFSQQAVASPFLQLNDLPSQQAELTEANVDAVMLATGSIPLLLAPVPQIEGVADGQYYDGGITDYHFDLPLSHATGLTLYPHFYPTISPGWFDKSLKWRQGRANYHNALVLAPTAEFVASLPFGKIPDREDFKQLDTAQRMQYWRTSVALSERLAEEFAEVVAKGNVLERLDRF
ncbi:alpha/beta hydrolase [Shewanella baltica]|uniref:alpha/beta hydrolase n=1 Tax=Shewanella baltica TaxID=62322 RepID=UPI00217DBF62|nr:alpha/beta hydrolase [Shewanella baltica]MCS6260913.1 alpha/beta hydrolase [Shewanella baltica]